MAFKDNAVELEERVVAINRVTKVVKGGRNMRFAALGLGKLNSSVVKEDNAAIRGMVNAVSHLVTVEDVK